MKKILIILFTFLGLLSYGNQGEKMKQIKLKVNNKEIIFRLNNSKASEDLYNLLPLEADISNYSNNEKVFKIKRKLNTSKTELVKDSDKIGTLAYFEPWDTIVIFYGDPKAYPEVYNLGETIKGKEDLKDIQIGKYILEKN